ncbi:MAG: SDR family NAD(P)-dependent oxidoreductase [Pseudanabaenaceae cyanobacterium bins.68]|nr:SDR family NAD(P)-dependent oxidoreductase [Pseudanabaenaceae cyanobacterium bins.68]
MSELCVIVGMGEGNGMSIAKKFGKEGMAIAMIARNQEKLQSYQSKLVQEGITANFFLADSGDQTALTSACEQIQDQLGTPSVLIYNTAVPRMENILQTTFDTLVNDFQANVAGAIVCVSSFLPAMQNQNSGTILFTGGGFSMYPHPDFVSLSIGKAGIRVLANTLHQTLNNSPIKVGTVTICGTVNGNDPKYASDRIAEEYWKLHIRENSEYEIIY